MVEDIDVIGEDVLEANDHASLREVNLLAVAGREDQVERTDQFERRAAN